jgi:hypothetical protein
MIDVRITVSMNERSVDGFDSAFNPRRQDESALARRAMQSEPRIHVRSNTDIR